MRVSCSFCSVAVWDACTSSSSSERVGAERGLRGGSHLDTLHAGCTGTSVYYAVWMLEQCLGMHVPC